jgi:23S rRNA-/tRNA-specific pseudouridylate synthase
MKDKSLQNIIEKYENGDSSINEEKILHNHIDESDQSLKSWSRFIKNHKTEVPEKFNERLWEKFESKTKSTRKLFIGAISIAASILLVLALYINNHKSQHELSYEEKVALLNQAREMLYHEDDIAQQDIIYEDDIIIIFTDK